MLAKVPTAVTRADVLPGVFAQKSGSGYSSVYDTSVITNKRMPQQNEFWNSWFPGQAAGICGSWCFGGVQRIW